MSLTITAELHQSGVFEQFIQELASFEQRVAQLAARGATTATQVSRERYRSTLSGRPTVAPRSGRPSTGGQLQNLIQWHVNATGDGVRLDVATLSSGAPYWPILEIGTGYSGQMITDAVTKSGPVFSIPSQVGRQISRGLVWATKGGVFMPPRGSVSSHQIRPISEVRRRRPRGPVRLFHKPMTITREIKPKHFIQQGGQQGFDVFQVGIYEAAAATFNYRGGRKGR